MRNLGIGTKLLFSTGVLAFGLLGLANLGAAVVNMKTA